MHLGIVVKNSRIILEVKSRLIHQRVSSSTCQYLSNQAMQPVMRQCSTVLLVRTYVYPKAHIM